MADEDEYDEDEDEYDDFEPDLDQVTPECCDMVKETQSVFMSLPEGFYEGESVKPTWQVRAWNKERNSTIHVDATYCPHCGKNLPEIVPVEPPRPVCKCSDGGYYCDECGERLQSCRCLVPEKAWGPKKDETNT